MVDYLLSKKVEAQLAESGFVQVPCRPLGIKIEGIPAEGIHNMKVNFAQVYQQLTKSREDMEAIFVR